MPGWASHKLLPSCQPKGYWWFLNASWYGFLFFFLNNLFSLKCKKHLGTAETDTKGGREGCMQGRALAAAAL
jgi:hypothetical protein